MGGTIRGEFRMVSEDASKADRFEKAQHPNQRTSNALSFDVEYWHSATLLSDVVEDPTDCVEHSVRTVLDLLDNHDVSATFFIVGELAEEYPDLVRRIADGGHEIGCHGYVHRPIKGLTPDEFIENLQQATEIIERITDVRPVGYRAPNFSVNRRNSWVFRILNQYGFEYDSSVFPRNMKMYGIENAPVRPYHVAVAAPFCPSSDEQNRSALVEFPVSVLDLPVRIPIAGGFYVRVLPLPFLKYGIRRLNQRGIPANLYFHPWEIEPPASYGELPRTKKILSFYGTDRITDKLDELLSSFSWDSTESVLETHDFLPESGQSDASPQSDRRATGH